MCLENIPQVFASAAAAPAGAKGKGKVPGKVPAPPRGATVTSAPTGDVPTGALTGLYECCRLLHEC